MMTENIEKKKGVPFIYYICGILLAATAALSFTTALYYNMNIENALLAAQYEVANKDISTAYQSMKTTCDENKSELDTLKARLAGIKNNTDLLKRDIELYIKHKYKKVPRTVAKEIAAQTIELCQTEDISPELVMGIMQIESQYNPSAVGPKTKYGHARGLMQVMPEWAPKFNLTSKYDLHDIDTNIRCGIKVFKIHMEEGGGKISEGLYLYVNKDKAYVDNVYKAMGQFVAFRSTVDDKKAVETEPENGETEEESKEETKDQTVKAAEPNNR
jgi:soluble lytic murein transglycosylase-like protein